MSFARIVPIPSDTSRWHHGARRSAAAAWFAAGSLGLGLTALTLLGRRIRRWLRRGAPSLPRAKIARERVREDDTASD